MKPKTLQELEPENPIMCYMWYGFIHWAIGREDIRSKFRDETGNKYQLPNTPIDKMIDEETDIGKEYVLEFAQWATKTLWGDNAELIPHPAPAKGED